MSWTDYQPPRAEIPLGGGKTGSVRGLNSDDLAILVTNHLEAISKAVALYAASKRDVYSTKNLHSFVISVATEFPGLLMEVISLGADEPSLKEKKVALGVQIPALQEIIRLTLEELGGLGNLSLVLGNLAKGVLSEYPNLRGPAQETTSQSSIGESAKT